MRVLLVSSSSGSQGGGELFLISLAQCLRELGHQPILWAANHSRMDMLCERFRPFGEVYRRNYRNTYDRRFRTAGAALDLVTAWRTAFDWRGLKPDVIHLNKQNLEDALDLVWAARFAGIPAVASIHVTQDARYLRARFSGLRDALTRSILRMFPGNLVAVGQSRLRDLQAFLKRKDSVAMVENGVPIPTEEALQKLRAAVRKRLGIRPDQLFGLGVGRLVEQKRPLLFLDIAEKILTREPSALFCWVGDGSLRADLDRIIAEKGLQDRITLAGWCKNVLEFYAAADFFLHTAEFEGLPLALLEALAAGLPVVVTPNLVQDLDFLDKHNSLSAVLEKTDWIDSLLDPADRAKRAKRARALATDRFSIQRMTSEYLALYESARAGN
jgi:glycosyltransferase involved in cell wall biosynthesis